MVPQSLPLPPPHLLPITKKTKKRRCKENRPVNPHAQQHLPFFVSNFLSPADHNIHADEEEVLACKSKEERRRSRRWKELKYIHKCINAQAGRYISVEKVLWTKSHITCREFVVVMMGKFRFENRTGIDSRLRKLYRSFDGAEKDQVDVREIVASFYLLNNHRMIRHNIYHVLIALFDLFGTNLAPYYPISRPDLMLLFRLPITAEKDVTISTKLIQDWLPKARQHLSRAAFLRRMHEETSGVASVEGWLVEESFSSSSLAKHFQQHAWNRLAADVRVSVLHRAEEVLAVKYEEDVLRHHRGLALHLYTDTLKIRTLKQWVALVAFNRRIRHCREDALIGRAKFGLRRWHENIVAIKWSRLKANASKSLGEAHRKKSRIDKLHTFARHMRAVKTFEAAHQPTVRLLRGGFAHLLQAWKSQALRQGFRRWFDIVWMMGAMNAAAEHDRGILLRKVLHVWRIETKRLVRQEREVRMRQEALKHVAELMQDADEAVRRHERILEEERLKGRLEEEEEANKQKQWAAMRVIAEKKAHKRLLMTLQDDARNRRAAKVKAKLREDFDEAFDQKEAEALAHAVEEVDSWFGVAELPTAKGRDIVQPAFKSLKTEFYRPPRVGEEELEAALRDLANIIFVIIEALLHSQGITLRDLFDRFDTDGSGSMNHTEFVQFMNSLPINLSGQKIRDIIAKVDANHDNDISIDELEDFMQQAIDRLGVPGSPWKMYVDPSQSVMCYHNILTDEKVLDYNMSDGKLLEILHANMKVTEKRRVEAALKQEREEGLLAMVQTYSAYVIQRQVRIHLARKRRNHEYWRLVLMFKTDQERKDNMHDRSYVKPC